MSDATQEPTTARPSAWWNPIYGRYRDEKRAWRVHNRRIDALPDDYRWMMKQIQRFTWNIAADANAMAGLDGILELFEEAAAAGTPVLEVTGDDVAGFTLEVLSAFDADRWIDKAGEKIDAKVRDLLEHPAPAAAPASAGPSAPEEPEERTGFGIIGKIRDDKREWRRQMARIAALPSEYRAVYAQIQKYMWAQAVGTGYDILHIQYDLVDEFEAGALAGRPVVDITGPDVAAYCDELLRTAKTFTATKGQALNRRVADKFGKKGQHNDEQ